jgi:hypothetical protein
MRCDKVGVDSVFALMSESCVIVNTYNNVWLYIYSRNDPFLVSLPSTTWRKTLVVSRLLTSILNVQCSMARGCYKNSKVHIPVRWQVQLAPLSSLDHQRYDW